CPSPRRPTGRSTMTGGPDTPARPNASWWQAKTYSPSMSTRRAIAEAMVALTELPARGRRCGWLAPTGRARLTTLPRRKAGAARGLYASAAYDEALALLNRMHASERPAAEARVIEQYRAFCLLALGRAADAERAIEAVVTAEPSYHPSDNDVSPRIRNAFADV